jgi:RNA polymerase sigma factor (sigma-70 family)
MKQLDREMIIQALQLLDEKRRNLIVLRFYQELKLNEISNVLDLPLSTVKTRLYQSLKALHEILERLEGNNGEKKTKRG